LIVIAPGRCGKIAAVAMRRLRLHLIAVTIMTLTLHAGAVTFGALRVCWGGEHRHAGVRVDDCAMHHQATTPGAQHAHQHHEHAGPLQPQDEGERIACRCSNDTSSPYVGQAATVTMAVAFSHGNEASLLKGRSAASPADIRFPPLLPPPRSTFSPLS
jgi:hypothetical protein